VNSGLHQAPRTGGRVVVGVTGTETSERALAFALDVARSRGWTLDVVTAWPDLGMPFVREVPGHYNDARGRLVEGLKRALARCMVELDGPMVRVWVENADPVEALVRRCADADLLVLGTSSQEGTSRRLGLAPVSDLCRDLVACPIVVVDGPDHHLATSA
jgi:nucleotide-binding universal stress UspA family protein